MSVGRLVGLSVMISYKGGKLLFHAPLGALSLTKILSSEWVEQRGGGGAWPAGRGVLKRACHGVAYDLICFLCNQPLPAGLYYV